MRDARRASRLGLLLIAVVMAGLAVAACGEEMPAVEADTGNPVPEAAAIVADLSGVEVEMRHEPG